MARDFDDEAMSIEDIVGEIGEVAILPAKS